MLFIYYPKCSTCLKALKHLKQKEISLELRDIVNQTPSKEDLKQWIEMYGKGIKPFLNTSGRIYRELGLKDKINDMTIDEVCELLSSQGMLIKRPLLIHDHQIIIGYKKEVYEQL